MKRSLDDALFDAIDDERVAAQHGIPQNRPAFIKTLHEYGWRLVPLQSDDIPAFLPEK